MQAGRYACDVSHSFLSDSLTWSHSGFQLDYCVWVSIFNTWTISELAVDVDEAEGEEGMMSPSL